MDPAPLLVVHGVGNRSEEEFSKTTAFLRERLAPRHRLINVFWGDKAGVSTGLADTLPSLFPGGPDEQQTRAGDAAVRTNAIEAIHASAGASVGHAVRSAMPPGTKDAIADAVAASTYVKHVDDPEVLDAIGNMVAAVMQDGGATAVRSADGGPIGSVIAAADVLIGKLTTHLGGSLNQTLRRRMAVPIALTFGDVVAYHQNRDAILQRLFECLDDHASGWGTQEKPVNVMAHSLGGLAVVDAATTGLRGRKLWIDRLATFGSQPAFFHVVAPRYNLSAYQPGHPVQLPGSIAHWTNLWHRLDVLAFMAKPVFVLADGTAPVEVDVASRGSEISALKGWLHSIYWESQELLDAWK